MPGGKANLEQAFDGPQGIMSSIMCSALSGDRQSADFRPIGALVSYLTQKLAWEDPAVRDLADYFRLANLWGAGEGPMRPWPLSVYSEDVRLDILAGRLT